MESGKLITLLKLGRLKRIYNDTIKNRQVVKKWIRELKDAPAPKGRVLISAFRHVMWIEWAAYCSCVCRQMGYEATLLYKESEIKKFFPQPSWLNFWIGIQKIPGIRFVNIEELPFDQQVFNNYLAEGHDSIVAAVAYDHHVESADIVNDPSKYLTKLNALKETAAINGARVFKYLSTTRFHQFICYSGIISDTNLIVKGALDAGQDVGCVEGWGWRPGHMIYNMGAPALEYNVQGWLNSFGKWNKEKEAEMMTYFSFLDGNKYDSDWLKDFYPVQPTKISEIFPDYITDFLKKEGKVFLLACNVIGDSSLLNRETIFRSHREFIKKTVDYFRSHKDIKLIIRVHPAEEWVKAKVSIKLGAFSRSISEGMENVLVIDSTEKLNTFSLVPYAHTGIIWVTSAGVDLVVRGVPVIAAAKPKYQGLGIVNEPATQEEFFALIDYYSKTEKKVSADQIQKAKEYLYMVFRGFSFEAHSNTWRASSCILNNMPHQQEHDRFYKILLKLEPAPDNS